MTLIISGAPASVVYTDSGSNTSSPFNTLTQGSESFGSESPNRRMIVLVHGNNANVVNDSNYTTAVTVGGVAATRILQPTGNQVVHATAWITPETSNGGPSGTSGAVTIQRAIGNGFTFCGYGLFAAYNLRSGTPVDSIDVTGNPPSGTIDLAGNGILVALAWRIATNTFDWTGATEQFDVAAGVSGSQRISGALESRTAAQTGRTVTADAGGTNSYLIAASFR